MRRGEAVNPSPPHARAPGARHSAGPAWLAQSLRPSASSRNAEGTIHAPRDGIGRVSNPATFLLGRLFDSTACPTPALQRGLPRAVAASAAYLQLHRVQPRPHLSDKLGHRCGQVRLLPRVGAHVVQPRRGRRRASAVASQPVAVGRQVQPRAVPGGLGLPVRGAQILPSARMLHTQQTSMPDNALTCGHQSPGPM